MTSLLQEGMKIGVVGKSGSGKSLIVDVLAFALICQKEGAGDYMRKLALNRGFDLETFSHRMTTEDDYIVDQRTIDLLTNCCWTGLIHGRLPRLLAEGLIYEGRLDRSNYLNITVVCDPEVRAQRGLEKFRLKPGKENATVNDVLHAQRDRDAVDFARIRRRYGMSHSLTRQGQLYGAQDTVTKGIEHNSVLMNPRQELMLTLGVLHNLRKITRVGYNIAAVRGLAYSKLRGF